MQSSVLSRRRRKDKHMGGKPSKGTSKDMRLAANKPNTGKPTPPQPVKKPAKKGGS